MVAAGHSSMLPGRNETVPLGKFRRATREGGSSPSAMAETAVIARRTARSLDLRIMMIRILPNPLTHGLVKIPHQVTLKSGNGWIWNERDRWRRFGERRGRFTNHVEAPANRTQA